MKENVWKKMDKLIGYSKPPTGDEWFTVAEFAANYGMHHNAAAKKLSSMRLNGVVEQWRGQVPGFQGKQTRYRIKGGAK